MKKIFSFITLLAIVVCALISCAPGVDSVISCYERSYPVKIVVESEQMSGSHGLSSVTTITRGEIGEDEDFIALMTFDQTELRSVGDGSGPIIEDFEKTTSITKNYREGYGVREKIDGVWGEWDSEGVNFFPEKGALGLTLDTSAMTDIKFENNKLSFTVKAGEVTKIFGEDSDIKSDVNVVITTDGAVVIGVLIEYVVPEDLEIGAEEMTVKVEATYSYNKIKLNIEG